MNEDLFFISALDLSKHPINIRRQEFKDRYYYVLKYYTCLGGETEHINAKLERYRNAFSVVEKVEIDINSYIKYLLKARLQPWKNKYKIWLICDLALILEEETKLRVISDSIKKYLSKKQGSNVDKLLEILYDDRNKEIPKIFTSASELIRQYWENRDFKLKKQHRIVITANMSAGKSTLINAEIGRAHV